MRGRSLSSEVSVSEMQHMRDEGMSNQEIADALDVSRTTVFRYIGGQGYCSERRKKPVEAPPPVKKPVEEEVIPASLLVENRIINLVGSAFNYRVEIGDSSTIVMLDVDGDRSLGVSLDNLDDFIAELTAIRRKCGDAPVFEAW